MRNRYLQEGADGMASHEILEILLYGTIPRGDTNEIAHHLLDEFGSISNLIEADPHEIAKTAGVGIKSAVFLSLLHELVLRYEREKLEQKPALTSIPRSVDYCKALLAFRPRECFYAICLDSRRKIIHTSKISEGTVNDAAVSPRVVVEKALRYKATGVLLCHNHPSGNVKPSYEDIILTNQLKNMLEPLGVQVVDHIIIGENQYFSFFENDMLRSSSKE
jgi:DNA repair protein RadC